MKKYDVIVVGLGFAGLSAAKVLAQKNLNVLCIDKKEDLSHSIHTTGIIVQEAIDEWDIDSKFLKTVSKVSVFGPNLQNIAIDSQSYQFYLTATGQVLNEQLANIKAFKNVDIVLNTKVSKIKKINDDIVLEGLGVSSQYLIYAGGAKTHFIKEMGFEVKDKFLVGHELEFDLNTLQLDNTMNVFIHPDICKGYIGWLVSGVESIQVGLAVNRGKKLSMDDFIEHIHSIFPLDVNKAIDQRSGIIPIGMTHAKVFKDNILLVGDAAGYVSPLTAGGIHTAMRYGKLGAELIVDLLKNEHFSYKTKYIKTYQSKLPKFKLKHLAKKLFDMFNKTWFINILFKSRAIFLISRVLFYVRKKLKS